MKGYTNRNICMTNLAKIPKQVANNRAPVLTSVYMCNPRSLVNKFDEFWTSILELNADIAGISESWFTPDNSCEHFEIDNYVLVSKHRENQRGSGVALYV